MFERANSAAALGGRAAAIMALLCAVVWHALPALGQQDAPAATGRVALVLDVDGAIGPATTEYLRQGLASAAERDAALVVVRLDTPGGLSTSMREIIQEFLASPVPVVTFVAPSGARAASAGTYLLYASHLAAMAPGTNLGAATPVQIGGGAQPLGDPPEEGEEETPADAITAKAVNDAVAYIRSLAELRGRNADWAEAAVREAESLSARAALERDVVEIVAPDIAALLAQADGREVMLGERAVTLDTEGLEVVEVPADWRTRLLAVIADPNLAYILMLVGIYGIIFELVSPGAVIPGVIGGISLIVALFALNMLPLNYAGIGLVLFGVALMTAEAFAPSFGILGIGGAVAFALGSLFMFEEAPGFRLSLPVVLAATVASAALLAVALAAVLRAHRRAVASGDPAMVGTVGEVVSWSNGSGIVLVWGERWEARSAVPLVPGARVRILSRDGLTLTVDPEPSP